MMQALRKDDLLQSLADLETGDPWDDAELWSVYSYVRGQRSSNYLTSIVFALYLSQLMTCAGYIKFNRQANLAKLFAQIDTLLIVL